MNLQEFLNQKWIRVGNNDDTPLSILPQDSGFLINDMKWSMHYIGSDYAGYATPGLLCPLASLPLQLSGSPAIAAAGATYPRLARLSLDTSSPQATLVVGASCLVSTISAKLYEQSVLTFVPAGYPMRIGTTQTVYALIAGVGTTPVSLEPLSNIVNGPDSASLSIYSDDIEGATMENTASIFLSPLSSIVSIQPTILNWACNISALNAPVYGPLNVTDSALSLPQSLRFVMDYPSLYGTYASGDYISRMVFWKRSNGRLFLSNLDGVYFNHLVTDGSLSSFSNLSSLGLSSPSSYVANLIEAGNVDTSTSLLYPTLGLQSFTNDAAFCIASLSTTKLVGAFAGGCDDMVSMVDPEPFSKFSPMRGAAPPASQRIIDLI